MLPYFDTVFPNLLLYSHIFTPCCQIVLLCCHISTPCCHIFQPHVAKLHYNIAITLNCTLPNCATMLPYFHAVLPNCATMLPYFNRMLPSCATILPYISTACCQNYATMLPYISTQSCHIFQHHVAKLRYYVAIFFNPMLPNCASMLPYFSTPCCQIALPCCHISTPCCHFVLLCCHIFNRMLPYCATMLPYFNPRVVQEHVERVAHSVGGEREVGPREARGCRGLPTVHLGRRQGAA